MRLIEDMRQLADEVLGVADDALERLPEPEALLGGPEGQAPPELPAVLDDEEEDADTTVAAEPVPLPEDSDGAELGDGEDPDRSTVEFPGPDQQPQEQPQRDRQG